MLAYIIKYLKWIYYSGIWSDNKRYYSSIWSDNKSYYSSIWSDNGRYYPQLKLEDLKEIRTVKDDTWNKVRNGQTTLDYYTKDGTKVGYIKYKTNGQIGLFFINDEYQNRGLGKQILYKVIKELFKYDCSEVWAVTTDNHPFWSNVYNKQFKPRHPVHPSVTGSGYYLNIKELCITNSEYI